MHTCRFCKKHIGGVDKSACYAFEGNDFCKKCLESVSMGRRVAIDRAVIEGDEFLKRVKAGVYMNPKEDILGYGKKK